MKILAFLIVFKVLVLADQAEESFLCNSLIQTNRTASSTPCALFWYKKSEKQCLLYDDSWGLVPQQSDQICQRVSYIPSTVSTISTMLPQTTAISNPFSACPPTFTNYVRNGSSNCPSLSNCTCDNIVGTTSSDSASADACFDACATNSNCLAFSYFPGICYLATQASHLTLTNSPFAFTCYCQKMSAANTSVTVIDGISYSNLSCYPQGLFSGSYSRQIPLVNGKSADCICQGGLYIQNGAYVDQTAQTFVDCFNSCATISSPPCKAFAFTERNNTCVIGPTSGNGPSSNTGILTCFT